MCEHVHLPLTNFPEGLKGRVRALIFLHYCHIIFVIFIIFFPEEDTVYSAYEVKKITSQLVGQQNLCFKLSKSPSTVGRFVAPFQFDSIYFVFVLDLVAII